MVSRFVVVAHTCDCATGLKRDPSRPPWSMAVAPTRAEPGVSHGWGVMDDCSYPAGARGRSACGPALGHRASPNPRALHKQAGDKAEGLWRVQRTLATRGAMLHAHMHPWGRGVHD